MNKAAIDIGSNSVLLVVVGPDGKVLHDQARVVGLGKGLGERGLFRTDRMELALGVLREYAEAARALGVAPERVRVAATSASRRALNAATFYAAVRVATGLKVDVISGDDEARLTWTGGVSGLDLPPGPVLLADVGGGSTEVILGEGQTIRTRISLEIGTVRLTEQFLGYGPTDPGQFARMRQHIAEVVKAVDLPLMPRVAVAVAGTATTLTAIELGLSSWDSARIHGATLNAGSLRRLIDRLLVAGPEARRALAAVCPERADTLLAGAMILSHLLESTRRQSWRISERGLRFGLLTE